MKRLLGAVILSSAAAIVHAQAPAAPEPTFRTEINYVQIPVRVLDARGEFVRGLTQSDFQIFEDGRPQSIAAFRAIDIPLAGHEPDPDADFDGRVYTFIIDNQNMNAATALRTRHVMRRFLRDGVAANDLAAIVFTGSGRGQSFTQSGLLLEAALDRLMSDADPTDNEFRRLTRLIADTAQSMGAIRDRRKAMVLITGSTICAITNTECRGNIENALRASIQSDVSIYAIDSRGLNAYERTSAEHANPNSSYGLGGYTEAPSGASARAAFAAARSEFHGPLSATRYLADHSGGFAVVNTNSLMEGFSRVVRENSAYYLLGYYSTNSRADGKMRRNQITVSRKGLQVAHRKGYLAPPEARKN